MTKRTLVGSLAIGVLASLLASIGVWRSIRDSPSAGQYADIAGIYAPDIAAMREAEYKRLADLPPDKSDPARLHALARADARVLDMLEAMAFHLVIEDGGSYRFAPAEFFTEWDAPHGTVRRSASGLVFSKENELHFRARLQGGRLYIRGEGECTDYGGFVLILYRPAQE